MPDATTTAPAFPATLTVHWPTGPAHCCKEHAGQLVALGGFMGTQTAVEAAPPGAECGNCKNEHQLAQAGNPS